MYALLKAIVGFTVNLAAVVILILSSKLFQIV